MALGLARCVWTERLEVGGCTGTQSGEGRVTDLGRRAWMSINVPCLSGLCVADNSTSHFRSVRQKIRTLKCHNENISWVFFSFRSLCVQVTFLVSVDSERHFILQKNFNWSFLACCEIRIYLYEALSGLELDRNIHLTALSDETVHQLIVLLRHWESSCGGKPPGAADRHLWAVWNCTEICAYMVRVRQILLESLYWGNKYWFQNLEYINLQFKKAALTVYCVKWGGIVPECTDISDKVLQPGGVQQLLSFQLM